MDWQWANTNMNIMQVNGLWPIDENHYYIYSSTTLNDEYLKWIAFATSAFLHLARWISFKCRSWKNDKKIQLICLTIKEEHTFQLVIFYFPPVVTEHFFLNEIQLSNILRKISLEYSFIAAVHVHFTWEFRRWLMEFSVDHRK